MEAARSFAVELVVVDNGSADGSVAVAREAGALVIENKENLGFARAVNQGLDGTAADFVLLLNPDARVKQGGLCRMVSTLGLEKVAAVGPRLTGKGGGSAGSGYYLKRPTLLQALLFYTYLLRPFATATARCRYLEECGLDDGVRAVDQVPGACLLTTGQCLAEIGSLDERFPIWFEDVDWCERARNAGFLILYDGVAEVEHLGGQSFRQWSGIVKEIVFYRSMRLYFWKHRPVVTPVLVVAVVVDRVLRLVMTRRRHHAQFLAGYLSRSYPLPK